MVNTRKSQGRDGSEEPEEVVQTPRVVKGLEVKNSEIVQGGSQGSEKSEGSEEGELLEVQSIPRRVRQRRSILSVDSENSSSSSDEESLNSALASRSKKSSGGSWQSSLKSARSEAEAGTGILFKTVEGLGFMELSSLRETAKLLLGLPAEIAGLVIPHKANTISSWFDKFSSANDKAQTMSEGIDQMEKSKIRTDLKLLFSSLEEILLKFSKNFNSLSHKKYALASLKEFYQNAVVSALLGEDSSSCAVSEIAAICKSNKSLARSSFSSFFNWNAKKGFENKRYNQRGGNNSGGFRGRSQAGNSSNRGHNQQSGSRGTGRPRFG